MKTNLKVLKFKKMKDQSAEANFSLDQKLIPYWHLTEDILQGEYTACGQAIPEYEVEYKQGKVTCPDCLKKIKFYEDVLNVEEAE